MTKSNTTEPTVKILNREGFLKSGNQRRTKIVDVPGLGPVKIRSLKERERSRYEADTLDDSGDVQKDRLLTAKRRLIVLCVVDLENEPILTDDDLDALDDKDGGIINYLFNEISRFIGIDKKDFSALLGNSNETNGGGSS